ncbi:SDR family oxidoreductase [Diaminobutyricibacter tongyongensis]|uniref:SDR family oxidoreductase n=1 Tax=Leifsonia tongyongensis TaxID=1268043 RepID=A0A6L9Y2S6_9MICO|nr:SDR family oxidoreductase [Diaminobutyricibacter tongyongensis]NEN07825.1 SDR family oxidoreductase [Diaminobutyricibacter tongyongensis]
MDLGLHGRTALVAASTGGLGRAIAESLGHEGAHVVITGRRLAVAQEIAESLPSAIGVELDVTDPSSRAAAIAATEAWFGAVDILVVNGPGPRPSTTADLSTADLTAAFDQLVSPGHDFIMRTLPGMRARGWGRILAVGSSGVVAPLPNLAASNLGRSALAGYLKTLANEVAGEGVTVNLLLPGRIATDRVARLDAAQAAREGIDAAEVTRSSQSTIPVGRYGTPEEFGDAAAFLCSVRASYITGVALRCDGGLVRTH